MGRKCLFTKMEYVLDKGHIVYIADEDLGTYELYGYFGDDSAESNSLIVSDRSIIGNNASVRSLTRANVNQIVTAVGVNPSETNPKTRDHYPPTGERPTYSDDGSKGLSFSGGLFTRSAAGLATAGAVGNFSFGAWIRIDALLEQYVTLLSIVKSSAPGESGSYFWFGHDSQAGPTPGSRGLAIFGPGGSHAFEVLPALGTWFHAAVTKSGQTVRVYLNGTICTQDGNAGQTTLDIGSTTYDEIDTIYLANEIGFGGLGFTGAIAAPFITKNVLSALQVGRTMTKQIPLNAVGSSVGSWPFATDLSDGLGGEAFVRSGASITLITGPTAIIS